ncbi:NAD-dependent epimerase/dehydratase family protein, partial [Amycolatopsis magusensis]|uniref:NAD-dependent epimerase/dehydratase family protein n=1 Tax=Amycolatopsis magusensis TaxID=882444 RepID=UPI0024A9D253
PAAELALAAATRAGRVRGISLRLPSVYGTADGPGMVARMVRRAIAGQPLVVRGEAAERDLLHVDDVVTALLAAIAHADALAGRHWAVGTGTPVRVAELSAAIAAAVAEHRGRAPVPVVVAEPPDPAPADDHRGAVADPVAFHAVTGWVARVPLATGLADVVGGALSDSL